MRRTPHSHSRSTTKSLTVCVITWIDCNDDAGDAGARWCTPCSPFRPMRDARGDLPRGTLTRPGGLACDYGVDLRRYLIAQVPWLWPLTIEQTAVPIGAQSQALGPGTQLAFVLSRR